LCYFTGVVERGGTKLRWRDAERVCQLEAGFKERDGLSATFPLSFRNSQGWTSPAAAIIPINANMTKHILFVHGTGVREPAYDRSLEIIAAAGARAIPGLSVLPCYWGGPEGCRLRADGKSIPEYDTARAIAELEEPELAIARWRLLYEYPESELDAVLGSPGQGVGFVAGREFALDPIAQMLATASQESRRRIAALELDQVWETARGELDAWLATASEQGREIPPVDTELRAVLARALVAHALVLRHAGDESLAWPTGEERDALVESLFNDWGGTDRGLLREAASWIKDRLKQAAFNLGTSKIARKRGVLSDAAYPGAGDILLYQARGEGIRGFIEAKIAVAPKPLVVLAHSLGGIACVDLLASQQQPGVDLLVTVGSQAPLLYELNALCSLPFDQPLPKHFPRWLNIYDKRDFLSYLGAGVFPDRVRDVQVDNGQPFPQSHSAYWSNAEVWKAVAGSIQ
jgi:hypothetical protein